jgi:hypothetical protein
MTISAFPLCWPDTIPRNKGARETGQFKTSLAQALKNVQDSLRKFGNDSRKPITDIVLSSNVTLGATRPADPGVAAWFTWEGAQVCIPVDRYSTVEANLQAIYHVVEARRVELRHGTLALVRASMQGFKALPAPKRWWDVLDVPPDAGLEDAEAAYRRLAALHHPDKPGGSAARMAELNDARDRARRAYSE